MKVQLLFQGSVAFSMKVSNHISDQEIQDLIASAKLLGQVDSPQTLRKRRFEQSLGLQCRIVSDDRHHALGFSGARAEKSKTVERRR